MAEKKEEIQDDEDLKEESSDESAESDESVEESDDPDKKKEGSEEGDDNAAGDDTVTLKKSELSKMKSDLDNYRKATLKYKKDGERSLSDDPEKDDDPEKEKETSSNKESEEPLTKKDFYRSNEKKAIKVATTTIEDDDPQTVQYKRILDENWDEVRNLYVDRSGKDTPEDIIEDLFDATVAYMRRHNIEPEEDEEAKAELSHISTKGSKRKAKKDKKRKSILKKQQSVDDWYE